MDHFLHFYPPKNLKNLNFEKMKKKTPGDITLHKCTKNHDHMLSCSKNHDHMLYCSWDTEIWYVMDGIIFHFGLTHMEISSFYTGVPKIMIIWYTVPEIRSMTDVICNCCVSFWATFCPFTPPSPWQPKKWQFQKNEKKAWRYHHFRHVYQKLWLNGVRFLRYGV